LSKERGDNMKILGNIITGLMVVFLVWGALSYGEILLKNLTDSPSYCALNLFQIILK
jgi:hypothetical protein